MEKLTFHNCTHLSHDFVASENGCILETATLFKNRTRNVRKRLGDANSTGKGSGPSSSNPAILVQARRCRVGFFRVIDAVLVADLRKPVRSLEKWNHVPSFVTITLKNRIVKL